MWLCDNSVGFGQHLFTRGPQGWWQRTPSRASLDPLSPKTRPWDPQLVSRKQSVWVGEGEKGEWHRFNQNVLTG